MLFLAAIFLRDRFRDLGIIGFERGFGVEHRANSPGTGRQGKAMLPVEIPSNQPRQKTVQPGSRHAPDCRDCSLPRPFR